MYNLVITNSLFIFFFSLSLFGQTEQLPVQDKANPVVVIKTTMGDITIELYEKNAPETVKHFLDLVEGRTEFVDPKTVEMVKRPFYNGIIFHRVIPNFMIQTGDPTGTGRGGSGHRFNDEINADSLGLGKTLVKDSPMLMRMYPPQMLHEFLDKSVKEFYEAQGNHYITTVTSIPPRAGSVAMANSGPDSNDSQFFINEVDTPWLDGKHTVFGKVMKGMDVVHKIANVQADQNGRPLTEIKIVSIEKLNNNKEK